MDIEDLIIGGDTGGIEWRLPVYRFKGSDPSAPSVHIQAALHAGELPGTALAHFLCERLRRAEADGAIRGDVAVIPHANPIGLAQAHFGEMQGRFDLGTRTNFNRDFPLVALAERETLMDGIERRGAVDRLKRRLLHMALGSHLVIDLHCDDESLQYAYVDAAFWPEAADLAAALDMRAVFLSDGESTAFEEAVGHAFKRRGGAPLSAVPGRLAVTVELRGKRDVDAESARANAEGSGASSPAAASFPIPATRPPAMPAPPCRSTISRWCARPSRARSSSTPMSATTWRRATSSPRCSCGPACRTGRWRSGPGTPASSPPAPPPASSAAART